MTLRGSIGHPSMFMHVAFPCRSKEDSSPVVEETEVVKQTPSEGEKKISTLKPPRFKGERDLSIKAKLAGVELTLSDRSSNLLMADVKGIQC